MYAVLGEIEFKVVAFWDGFKSTMGVDYATHARIEGKPGVQFATFGAAHGFLDADNSAWQAQPAQSANLQIDRFLAGIAR